MQRMHARSPQILEDHVQVAVMMGLLVLCVQVCWLAWLVISYNGGQEAVASERSNCIAPCLQPLQQLRPVTPRKVLQIFKGPAARCFQQPTPCSRCLQSFLCLHHAFRHQCPVCFKSQMLPVCFVAHRLLTIRRDPTGAHHDSKIANPMCRAMHVCRFSSTDEG